MKRKVVYMPKYGLGSWLQENAGVVGSTAGSLIGGPVGGAIGGLVGGMVQSGYDKQQQSSVLKGQQNLMNQQAYIQNYNANPNNNPVQYANNFACGGKLKMQNGGIINSLSDGGQLNFEDLNSGASTYDQFKNGGIMIKPSHRGLLHKQLGVKAGEKIPASKLAIKESDSPATRKRKQFAINARKWSHADGGLLNSTSGIDGITMYPASAGTHESSNTGGIPIGKYGTTEGNEVRVGKYVFSNRF